MPARRAPRAEQDRQQDQAVEDSFPASDPPANSGIVGPRSGTPPARQPPHERDDESRPTGTPTHERHAAETAYVWEDEERPPDPARRRGG